MLISNENSEARLSLKSVTFLKSRFTSTGKRLGQQLQSEEIPSSGKNRNPSKPDVSPNCSQTAHKCIFYAISTKKPNS